MMEEKTKRHRETYDEDFKKDTIRKLKESKLNMGVFCKQNDLNPSTVQSWKSKYNGSESNDIPTAEVQTETLPVKKNTGNRYDINFINDFLDEYEKSGPEITIKAFAKSKEVIHSTAYKWVQRRSSGQENYQSTAKSTPELNDPTILDIILNEIQELKLTNKLMLKRLEKLDPIPNPNVVSIDFTKDLHVLEELDNVCEIKRRNRSQQIIYMVTNHKDVESHG